MGAAEIRIVSRGAIDCRSKAVSSSVVGVGPAVRPLHRGGKTIQRVVTVSSIEGVVCHVGNRLHAPLLIPSDLAIENWLAARNGQISRCPCLPVVQIELPSM